MHERHESKSKFLNAAIQVMRSKGYVATTVDDICEEAALSKGSFFHHFGSKEQLAVEAAAHWDAMTGTLFASSTYHQLADPLERLLAYIDLRYALIDGPLPEFTCYLGTIVQETFATHPALREACGAGITGHAHTLVADIAAAKEIYAPVATWTPESLALYTQAVIQGAFVLTKATGSADLARDCITHLRRYLELLFKPGEHRGA